MLYDLAKNSHEFDQEADKLEQAADDPRNYYVIEKEPIICKYISVPKGISLFYNSKLKWGASFRWLFGLNFAWGSIKSATIVNTRPSSLLFLDKSSLNCAAFAGGIIEAVLCSGGFPAKVTTHWHKGTTFMIQFNESVIEREKQ